MTSERQSTITLSQIKDQIAALMYAYGVVHDNEEILEIKINDLSKEQIPLTLKLKVKQEVKVIQHNG